MLHPITCLLRVLVEVEADEDAASSARVCFLSFAVAASGVLLSNPRPSMAFSSSLSAASVTAVGWSEVGAAVREEAGPMALMGTDIGGLFSHFSFCRLHYIKGFRTRGHP